MKTNIYKWCIIIYITRIICQSDDFFDTLLTDSTEVSAFKCNTFISSYCRINCSIRITI